MGGSRPLTEKRSLEITHLGVRPQRPSDSPLVVRRHGNRLVENAQTIQGRLLTVGDHYAHGGLGDAVLSAVGPEGMKVHKLEVRRIPHSGKPDELANHFGIGARSIVEAAKQISK